MTAAEQLVDMRFLRTLVPLGELDNAQMQHLMGHYTVELVEAGSKLFSIGDNDAYTYYVLSGQVQLHFRSGSEREVKAQTTQARYMLVPERPRTATATATTTCTILKIEKDALDELVRWGDRKGIKIDSIEDESKQSDWMSHYLRSKVFLKLRAQNIQALMMKLEEIPVRAGQVIIRQGDDDGYYYIIKKGHCQVTRHDGVKDEEIELAVLTVGTGFGEEAIITHNHRGATVTMLDDGALMRISREDFRQLLVQPLIDDIEYKHALALGNQVFLDVRSYEDYMKDGLPGAENIALMQIRPNLDKFASDKIYVTYSDNGYAASAAAFLLCQQGINAIVLRGGTHGIPNHVVRGNQPEDDIPIVDNVIDLKNPSKKEKQQLQERDDFLPDDDFDEEAVLADPKLQSLLLPEKHNKPEFNTEQVMKNPAVAALFNDARDRAEAHGGAAARADQASRAAKLEVERLRREAEAAKRELEKARHTAEREAKQSAEIARQMASKEAARLRELELGAKQAEMEEAIRQAEEEARRAREAEAGREAAYQEIDNLKSQMSKAVENAKLEAKQSAEIIKQFVAEEARKQKQAAREAAQRESERARKAEQAQVHAQQEIERLKAEADNARKELQEHARQAAENARQAAAREAKRVSEEARIREEANRAQAEAEMDRMRDELAKSRAEAEAARVHAELQIQQMVEKTRQETQEQQVKARMAVEAAQLQNEQALEAKQVEIDRAISDAEDSSFRATEAERARDQALAEIELLRKEASKTQQELQNQLSEDIARSEIEHEVAKARAIELANKQSEIEEITRLADEQSNRAKIAENAQSIAQAEIERLKAEIQRIREQTAPGAEADDAEKAAWQRHHDGEIARKQAEIQAAMRQASEEAERAVVSEKAFKQADEEIKRLKAEMDIATRQAQAQLEADARRALQQQEEMERKAQVLAQQQAEISLAVERAEQEKRRAEEAEKARIQAEQALEKLKETAAANRKVMQELKRIRADAKDKEVAMRAADKRAAREAARAEKADRARKAAEVEIKRLKQLAIAQHRKAEQAIKESMKTPKTRNQTAKPQSPAAPKKENNAAWISDQVLWETTLGMREDAGAEQVIQPHSEDTLDEMKEILLTDIPLVPNKGAAKHISRATARDMDDHDPFLDDPIVYRSSVERSAFQARDINRNVTPQADAIAYVRRRRATVKAISVAVVIVGVIAAAVVAYQFLPTSFKPGKSKPVTTVKSVEKPVVKKSSSVEKSEGIEERVLKKRKEREAALMRKRNREAKLVPPAPAPAPKRSQQASQVESAPIDAQPEPVAVPNSGPSAEDFNSIPITASEPERDNTRSFSTPKQTRPIVTLRPQARTEPVPAQTQPESTPMTPSLPGDSGAIPALVAPAE